MISIIHPSRNRPKQCAETVEKWLSRAFNKQDIQYIISVDKDDRDLNRYKRVGIKNGTHVLTSRNKSAIEAINNAAKVSTGNLIITVSDDFNEPPLHWDVSLLMALEGKKDFIVKTQDGIQDWIITLPILDRDYYNRFGYVYFPEYKHLFCDTEMTSVADILARKITLDINIPHNHYSVYKSKKDAINVKNNKTWDQGEKLYNYRKSINFGL